MAEDPRQPAFNRLSVVLVSTRNPLNIGAAARAMSNFGFSQLRVVKPYELAFREAKSAVGASGVLSNARDYTSLADAVADCSLVVGTTAARDRKLDHELRTLRDGARLIRRRLRSERVALLFGSEKRGLSNRDLSYCHWLLRIPARPERRSMNLGQAVAVCLYELARDRAVATKPEKPVAATAAELDRLADILLDALRTSGYLQVSAAVAEDKVRRLLRRTKLSAQDAQVWSGMLRQMLWKMRAR